MERSVRHSRLGTLRCDRYGIWRTNVKVGDQSIRCSIVNLHGSALDEPIAVADRIIGMLRDMRIDYRDAIVEQLLDTYNAVWRYDGDPVLSAEQFLAMLRLEGVTVTPNDLYFFAGDRTLVVIVYDAGGMFRDHDVGVYVDDQANLLAVRLA